MTHDAVAIHTAIRAAASVSKRQCRTKRSHEGRDGGTVERGGREGGEYVGDEGGATAPEGGRDGADDDDGAGGKGERTGDDASDPRATPSTAAAACASKVPVGSIKQRD